MKAWQSALCGVASLLAVAPLHAETTEEVWGAWFHQHTLSPHWQLASDIQLRSTDGADDWRQLIIRPSIVRVFSPALSASLGYAHVENQSLQGKHTQEYRPWQQVQYRHAAGSGQLTHRVRLEQRFLESANDRFSSDRLRYSLRYQQPVPVFGGYLAAQNEWFGHLSARDKLNGQVFDQNRFALLAGKSVSPSVTLEAGWGYQTIAGASSDRTNQVLLLNVLTRFP